MGGEGRGGKGEEQGEEQGEEEGEKEEEEEREKEMERERKKERGRSRGGWCVFEGPKGADVCLGGRGTTVARCKEGQGRVYHPAAE